MLRITHYYHTIEQLLGFLVPPGQRVLDIGCGNGNQLAAVKPAFGVGVDLSSAMIALASGEYPLHFSRQLAEGPLHRGIA